MNILIVKLSAIGDVIHTLPSLAELRKFYPSAHISWVVEEASADVLSGHPDLDRVIVSRRKRWMGDLKSPSRARQALREIRQFLSVLKDRHYDLVIDFHGLFKSAMIVFLSGADRKLGYDSMQEMSGLFLNDKIPEDMGKHAVDRYLDFLRHLGSETPEPQFFIPVDEANREKIDGLLAQEGIGAQERFVAISPVALWETKLWDNAKFARLCDRIVRELHVKVVLTGATADGVVGHIQSLTTSPVANLGGRTSLRDLACLYGRASLLVTTDSGPMHIAAAVGTPVVALFGPTSPARTGPYGTGHTVVRKDLDCSPCFLKTCEDTRCMKEISVDDVFTAVKGQLARGGPEK